MNNKEKESQLFAVSTALSIIAKLLNLFGVVIALMGCYKPWGSGGSTSRGAGSTTYSTTYYKRIFGIDTLGDFLFYFIILLGFISLIGLFSKREKLINIRKLEVILVSICLFYFLYILFSFASWDTGPLFTSIGLGIYLLTSLFIVPKLKV